MENFVDMNTTVAYNHFGKPDDHDFSTRPDEQALFARYEEIAWAEELQWDTRYRKQRLLGAGGQGPSIWRNAWGPMVSSARWP